MLITLCSWLGVALMCLSWLVAIAWGRQSYERLMGGVSKYQSIDVPGHGPVRLQARKYILYLEGTGADEIIHNVRIVLRHRSSGRRILATPYVGTFSREVDGVRLAALSSVSPALAGVYDVRAGAGEDHAGFDLAFGEDLGAGLNRIWFGGWAIMIVLGFVGVAMFIVSEKCGERRKRPRRSAPP